MNSGFQVQLEEDGDGSTGQSGGDKWSMAYDTLGVTRNM